MKKTYTLDNISELFQEIDSKPNPDIKKYTIYCGYMRDQERQEKEIDIARCFGPGCYYATAISDDLAVVERKSITGQTQGYHAFYDKPNSILWDTFDKALLCALSLKYSGSYMPTEYAARVIDMHKG